jgi:hypothetical protein
MILPAATVDGGGQEAILFELGVGLQKGVQIQNGAVGGIGLDIAFPHIENIGRTAGGDQRLQLLEIILPGRQQLLDQLDTRPGRFKICVDLVAYF